ncbi:MAG: Flp pilus assembly complex ATPase component TadA [Oscillospiraceae bacterium]|nr:Flp pilus assembly complex ATPase component TadA [Oscillospiraceae bacterium]
MIRQPLSRISAEQTAEIRELRLRIGKCVQAVMPSGAMTVTKDGTLTSLSAEGIPVSRQLMDTVFQNLCSHSLHSWQHAIRQGFVTIHGGSRAGICGTAVIQDGHLENVRQISSLNIRIASERIGCAEELLRNPAINPERGGLLIAGAPASGKTTFLRDISRILGASKPVSLLDSRGELAAMQNGMPQFELGAQTDILDGYPKAEGVEIAVRVMSPAFLICDEIGSDAEAEALLGALHTGVHIIASAHAGSLAVLRQRPQISKLIESGAFRTVVMLGSGDRCGQVLETSSLRGCAG